MCRAGCLRRDTWDALFEKQSLRLNELTGMGMNISGTRWNVWGLLRLITEPCDKLLAEGGGFGWMFSFPYGNVYVVGTLLCRQEEDLEVS